MTPSLSPSVIPGNAVSSAPTGHDQGNRCHALRPLSPELFIHIFLAIIVVPLIAVVGHLALYLAPYIPPSINASIDDSLATYGATLWGSLILATPYVMWLTVVGGAPYVSQATWYASKLGAAPLGSFVLSLTYGSNPCLLDPFRILLAMAVGQGIVWGILRLTFSRSRWRKINGLKVLGYVATKD